MKANHITCNLFALLFIVTICNPANAQTKLFTSEKLVEFNVGYNYIDPTRNNGQNLIGLLQYKHTLKIKTTDREPSFAIILNPLISATRQYFDTTYRFYNLLQPGTASFVPQFRLLTPENKFVEAYAYVQGGLKYFSFEKNQGFLQWQTGVGAGFTLKRYFNLDVAFIRAGNDVSDSGKEYFSQTVSPSNSFRAIQATAKFYFNPPKITRDKEAWNVYAYITWQGYYHSYENQRFAVAGLGLYFNTDRVRQGILESKKHKYRQ